MDIMVTFCWKTAHLSHTTEELTIIINNHFDNCTEYFQANIYDNKILSIRHKYHEFSLKALLQLSQYKTLLSDELAVNLQ